MPEDCVVCFRKADLYGIGKCDHPVCHECSARMRVLCKQNECPICRKVNDVVVFTYHIQPFAKVNTRSMKLERRYNIYFEDDFIMHAYDELLEHSCRLCNWLKFKDFLQLKDHMRKLHESFYCDICVENLKIFPHERRFYSRSDLAQHRRVGDPDDRSHRGHPLCEFCETRFIDEDELFRHLRRDHFFCHFCEAEGDNTYYNGYNELRFHFKKAHFVCEEGNCKEERFTSAFRTKLDLQAHTSQQHTHTMSKAAARHARTVDIEFSKRNNADGRGKKTAVNNNDNSANSQIEGAAALSTQNPNFAQSIDINCAQDFPTLGGMKGGFSSGPDGSNNGNKESRRFTTRAGNVKLNEEEFPSLLNNKPSTSGLNNGSKQKENPPKPKEEAFGAMNGFCDAKPFSAASKTKASKGSTKNEGSSVNEKSKSQGKLMNFKSPFREEFPSLSSETTPQTKETTWVLSTSQKNKTGPADKKLKEKNVEKSPSGNFNALETTDFPNLNPSSMLKQSVRSSMTKLVKTPKMPSNKASKNNSDGSSKLSLSTQTKPSNSSLNKPNSSSSKSTSNTNSFNKTNKAKATENEAVEDLDGPAEDFSMCKIGDYRSIAPVRTSNINVVRFADRKTRENEVYEPPDLQSGDFPSLMGNSTRNKSAKTAKNTLYEIPNSNWNLKNFSITNNNTVNHNNNFSQNQNVKEKTSNKGKNKEYSYISPDNFEARNKMLIDTIKSLFNDNVEKFNCFKQLANKFRNGEIQGEEYYKKCRQIMGYAAFMCVLPEFIALLPDIKKQQGVLRAYNSVDGGKGSSVDIIYCSKCKQVLIPEDLSHHVRQH